MPKLGPLLPSKEAAPSPLPRMPAFSEEINAVTTFKGKFVAAGEGGLVLESSDGISWNPIEVGSSANFESATVIDGYLTLSNNLGETYVASDLNTFIEARHSGEAKANSTASGNGQIILLSGGDTTSKVNNPALFAKTNVSGGPI